MVTYSREFFADIDESSSTSAREVVPWLVRTLQPTSVADIGCGVGVWLREFQNNGVEEVFGIDGPWVTAEQLQIPPERFKVVDLGQPAQIKFPRRFDIAICLEVGEHLDCQVAPAFIRSVVTASDKILFSAAVPDQGGISHQNEQWPAYWIELFEKNGFRCLDVVRSRFWENQRVSPWYVQNMLLFVDENCLDSEVVLRMLHNNHSLHGKSVIHPTQYARALTSLRDPRNYSWHAYLKALPGIIRRKLQRSPIPRKS